VFVVGMRDAPPKDTSPRWYFVPSSTWTGAAVAVPPLAQQPPPPSLGPAPCPPGPPGAPPRTLPGMQPCAAWMPPPPPGVVLPPR
jgi:hypothetical protein